MAWQCFRLICELLSPLHIGYHKVGNVQRTRYYIPARNLWAAVTERLVRSGFGSDALGKQADDYTAVGDWVNEHIAFTYFFLHEDDALLYPCYTENGLCYGGLRQHEFERRYLAAHVTTALDPATTSAEAASLHEVEFIAPVNQDGPRTRIGGWVFLRDAALEKLGGEAKWHSWLRDLQVGGERRYGFGRLRLAGAPQPVYRLDGYDVELTAVRPKIAAEKGKPFWAHTLSENTMARGLIEPLVGRETRVGASFGQRLTRARICWTPGSISEASQQFVIAGDGIWELPRG
ncbi:MAG: hypothetical protein L0338_25270 [Acidobacteria bacterium]|nr:hypothetical protein [Acidobacteriota bacterium]